ncbi:pentatricopeptide repeat domain-containing protein [Phlyctema vagabunda]|uniref:Pentatricopeptide repeat domain-containing protein n=1 Tax=Phlyctema vagabunda TaxID=108571 RepID=A0ABR4PLM8_9HELO
MAPPRFPQGMTLYTIGYSTLKYPALPPELPVPLCNQIGVLQRAPSEEEQNHGIAQLASQYLPALLEFQSSDDPQLNDEKSAQYWFSTALCLLNLLTTNPDVCAVIVKHPTVVHDVIEKLLDPEIETKMKACGRLDAGPQFAPARFEDEFGTLLQFLSTILLHHPEKTEELHPRIHELIPKLKTWQRKYERSTVRTIDNASKRLVSQIEGMDPNTVNYMRSMQATSVQCGFVACDKKTDLTACSACKIQRYCGREHQKKDWKYHKHICNKGLIEESASAAEE